MPDYYRIENYRIRFCNSFPETVTGLINSLDTRIVNIGYYFTSANKCGNTVHDEMFPCSADFNGLYYNERSYDVRKIGRNKESGHNIYRIENIFNQKSTFFGLKSGFFISYKMRNSDETSPPKSITNPCYYLATSGSPL